ncbi:MAG: hypothetical protein AB1346_08235, partial [Thermodesulfobacteriota bacterium]
MTRKLLVFAVVLFTAGVCRAGWLEDTVTKAGKRLGERAINDTGSGAYKGAKDTVTGADKKKESAPANRPAPGRTGDPGMTAGAPPAGAPAGSPAASGRANAPSAAGPPSGEMSIEQAETILSKYDFVPGDKTIYSDDFSDTDVGEFPRKWTLSGPKDGGNNAVEVVESGGKRYLRSQPAQKGKGQNGSTQYIRLDQKGDLPEKFTIEFEAVFANTAANRYENFYVLYLLSNEKHWPSSSKQPGVLYFSGTRSHSQNTGNELSLVDGKPHRVQVSVNGTFVKAYVDQQRVINDPDGIKRP